MRGGDRTLGQVADGLGLLAGGEGGPASVRLAGWRKAPAVLAELAAELERRQKQGDGGEAPVFLFLFGLHRCRDLRKAEDDFGFLRKGDAPPNPSEQLFTLLREGPGLGLHVVVWCDSVGNLQRAVDRQALRELTLRVALQMNVADSSHLIDNPLASRLGPHRALFFDEENGRLEKFRPYAPPAAELLAHIRRRLAVERNLRAILSGTPVATS